MAVPRGRDAARVQTACRFCRYSKLKCSGTEPCDRCRKRSKECIYDLRSDQDSVTDRAAKRARRDHSGDNISIARLSFSASPGRSTTVRPSITTEEPASESQQEVPAETRQGAASPQFLRNRSDKRKRWLYLGASSTWAFNLRVAALIKQYLHDNPDDKYEGFTLDGDVHKLALKAPSTNASLDLTRLPSLDYAIYLVSTVQFHLGGMLRLFDEDAFLETLRDFYSQGRDKSRTNKLWYTQFLLVLALGKGFLNATNLRDHTASSDLFLRAMSCLPDTNALHEDPVPAVEVLATVALYFYRLDMKDSAYSYIGQAMRLALVEGMHTDLPAAQIGHQWVERCRNLWWTVYILDRTLSSAVGAPLSVQDDHIKQPLGSPKHSSLKDATLVLHVKLCRVVSSVLNELYTDNGNLGQSYLSKTRTVLLQMTDIAQELEETIDFKFKGSLETLSKGALHLRMLYNQCIILATRPLFVCLLQDLLGSFSVEGGQRAEIPTSLHDLLQTCVVSATKTLKMLVSLNEHNLLDTFLPFHLEFACSASSALIMVDNVLKGQGIPASSKSLIPKVLNDIAQGGNAAAPWRLKELEQIIHLATRFWNSDGRCEGLSAELQTPNAPGQHSEAAGGAVGEQAEQSPTTQDPGMITNLTQQDDLPFLAPMSTTSSSEFAHTFDFSQDQMLFLADQLDDDILPSMLGFGDTGLNEWM